MNDVIDANEIDRLQKIEVAAYELLDASITLITTLDNLDDAKQDFIKAIYRLDLINAHNDFIERIQNLKMLKRR